MQNLDAAITDLVDRIYDLPLEPEAWGDVAAAIERLTRGKVAVLVQGEQSIGFVQTCSAAGGADADDYLDRFWSTDRAMTRLRGAAAGATVVDSRLVSDADRQRVAFYRDYLGPRGLRRGCYTVLGRHGSQAVIMGIHRPDPNDDFGEECLKVLDRVRPHMARGLIVARRLAEERAARDAAAGALSQAGWAIILTTADGVVRFANASGEARFRDGTFRMRGGRIDVNDAGDGRALRTALARAARRKGGTTTMVTLDGVDGAALSLSVSPARPGEVAGTSSEPLAMVLLAEAQSPPPEMRLRREYGLTPAEGRLLRALVAGERLSDYADRAGVRRSTVKTHLNNVFAKIGVGRQTELVRRALTDPALRLHLVEAPPEPGWGGAHRTSKAV